MTPSSNWRSGLRRFFLAQVPQQRRPPPPPPPPPGPTPWLDVEGVATRARVSTKTVYRALGNGALDGTKPTPGGHWRVSPAAVDSWIEAGRRHGTPRPTTKDVIGRAAVNPDHTWNP